MRFSGWDHLDGLVADFRAAWTPRATRGREGDSSGKTDAFTFCLPCATSRGDHRVSIISEGSSFWGYGLTSVSSALGNLDGADRALQSYSFRIYALDGVAE